MRRRPAALSLVLAGLVALFGASLAGCGEEREPVPDLLAVKKPKGAKREVFREAGITLRRPANWRVRRREAPGVVEIFSGQALVAVWAYPRVEPLPETPEQLESARRRLLEAIEERDPRFRLRSSRVTEAAGAPAIEVIGRQTRSRRRLRTRSVHVFEGGTEYVIEAIAPPRRFARADRGVLRPLLRSLRFEGEPGGTAE